MAVFFAVLLCFASGYLIVAVGWPYREPVSSDLPMRLSLAIGYGLGIFSVVFVLARAAGIRSILAADVVTFGLLLICYLLRVREIRGFVAGAPGHNNKTEPAWIHPVLAAFFTLALSASCTSH